MYTHTPIYIFIYITRVYMCVCIHVCSCSYPIYQYSLHSNNTQVETAESFAFSGAAAPPSRPPAARRPATRSQLCCANVLRLSRGQAASTRRKKRARDVRCKNQIPYFPNIRISGTCSAWENGLDVRCGRTLSDAPFSLPDFLVSETLIARS